ncbi:MAG: DUF2267 domain-containing protein [Allorhizobium sp.]
MPMPMEYRRASAGYDAFIDGVREQSGLTTSNQTYTMVQAVLLVFRNRLSLHEAIGFAQALPPVLRAIFVSDWDTEAPTLPFTGRDEMTREVKAFRRHHNFSPDTAIADTACVLWRHVDAAHFQRVLEALPEGSCAYWAP